MKAQEIVKECIKMREITQEELAKRVGYKGQTNITAVLNVNKTIRMDVFLKLLHSMGYELVVRDVTDRDIEWNVTEY